MIEMNPVMARDHKLLQNTKYDATDNNKDNEKLNVVVSDSRHAETPVAKMKQKQNRKKRQSE